MLFLPLRAGMYFYEQQVVPNNIIQYVYFVKLMLPPVSFAGTAGVLVSIFTLKIKNIKDLLGL